MANVPGSVMWPVWPRVIPQESLSFPVSGPSPAISGKATGSDPGIVDRVHAIPLPCIGRYIAPGPGDRVVGIEHRASALELGRTHSRGKRRGDPRVDEITTEPVRYRQGTPARTKVP